MSTGRPDDIAVVQSLEFLNGTEWRARVYKGAAIGGISFDQFDGRVVWDDAGVVRNAKSLTPEAVSDALWALLTSPEFQHIR